MHLQLVYACVAPQQALPKDKLDTFIPVDYAVLDHEKEGTVLQS